MWASVYMVCIKPSVSERSRHLGHRRHVDDDRPTYIRRHLRRDPDVRWVGHDWLTLHNHGSCCARVCLFLPTHFAICYNYYIENWCQICCQLWHRWLSWNALTDLSSWLLQMSWRQIGARWSATTMVTPLWLYDMIEAGGLYYLTCISRTVINQSMFKRGRQPVGVIDLDGLVFWQCSHFMPSMSITCWCQYLVSLAREFALCMEPYEATWRINASMSWVSIGSDNETCRLFGTKPLPEPMPGYLLT